MSCIKESEEGKKNKSVINTNNNLDEKNKEIDNQEKNINSKISNASNQFQTTDNYNKIKGIISAFFNYQVDALKDISRMERDFKIIGEKYIKLLPFNYIERLDKLKQAIYNNYSFLFKIAYPYLSLFKSYKKSSGEIYLEPLKVESKHIIDIRLNLRLFVRDWSIEGKKERNETYEPILKELKSYFKKRSKKDFEDGIKILVPGAGLGRLLYEIGKLGFKAQGNEISFNMMLFYSYLFDNNNNLKKNEFVIQPFIHSLSNLFNFDTALKKIMIPDENIKEELSKSGTGELSMKGGDFCFIYKEKFNTFDSVVTCFFIDTANNIIEYIETIYNTLKNGGLWINIGPLFYHHINNPNEVNIILAWNEIKDVINGFGFEITKEEIIETTYSGDEDSMIKRIYRCIFFTAVKK